jgi:hypothetical protein
MLSVAALTGMLAAIPLAWILPGAGPVPHAAVGVAGSLLSIVLHVRRGAGGDLGACLVLGLGLFLGVGVPDGVASPAFHAAVAVAGVALSSWVHVWHLRGAGGPARQRTGSSPPS